MLNLLQVMFQDGKLTAREVLAVQKTSEEYNVTPVQVLRAYNISSPEDIQVYFQLFFKTETLKNEHLALLSQQHGVLLPKEFCEYFAILPLGKRNGKILVGMEDPTDKGLCRKIEFLLDKKIVPVAATVFQIALGLKNIFGTNLENMPWIQPLTAQKVAEDQVIHTQEIQEGGDDENTKEVGFWPKKSFTAPSPQLAAVINQAFIKVSLQNDLYDALSCIDDVLKRENFSDILSFKEHKQGIEVFHQDVSFVFSSRFLSETPPREISFFVPLLKVLLKLHPTRN